MDAALDTLIRIRERMDAVADEMVGLVVDALLPEGIPQGLPEGADVGMLTASVERLRPVADTVAADRFGLAMNHDRILLIGGTAGFTAEVLPLVW